MSSRPAKSQVPGQPGFHREKGKNNNKNPPCPAVLEVVVQAFNTCTGEVEGNLSWDQPGLLSELQDSQSTENIVKQVGGGEASVGKGTSLAGKRWGPVSDPKNPGK